MNKANVLRQNGRIIVVDQKTQKRLISVDQEATYIGRNPIHMVSDAEIVEVLFGREGYTLE